MACSEYQDGSKLSAFFAILMVLGICGSYVPQQVRVARLGTVEGLSTWFLFLMIAGAAFGLANILIVSRPVYECCSSTLSSIQCGNALTGVLQMASAFVGPTGVLILAIIYAKSTREEHQVLKTTAGALAVLSAVLVVSIVFAFTFLSNWAGTIAGLWGLAASVVGLVQYLPQLWTTYSLKHPGSLSIVTLLIQIPGGLIWSLSLALREETNWTIWFPIFLAAILQLVLLVMAVYYSWQKPSETELTEHLQTAIEEEDLQI